MSCVRVMRLGAVDREDELRTGDENSNNLKGFKVVLCDQLGVPTGDSIAIYCKSSYS